MSDEIVSSRVFSLGAGDRKWWQTILLTLLWTLFGPTFVLIYSIIMIGGRVGYFIRAIPYFIRQMNMKRKGECPKAFREKCLADDKLQHVLEGFVNYWGGSISFSKNFYEDGAKGLVFLWELTALWTVIALTIYCCITYWAVAIPFWVASLAFHTAFGMVVTHVFFTVKNTRKLGFQTDD